MDETSAVSAVASLAHIGGTTAKEVHSFIAKYIDTVATIRNIDGDLDSTAAILNELAVALQASNSLSLSNLREERVLFDVVLRPLKGVFDDLSKLISAYNKPGTWDQMKWAALGQAEALQLATMLGQHKSNLQLVLGLTHTKTLASIEASAASNAERFDDHLRIITAKIEGIRNLGTGASDARLESWAESVATYARSVCSGSDEVRTVPSDAAEFLDASSPRSRNSDNSRFAYRNATTSTFPPVMGKDGHLINTAEAAAGEEELPPPALEPPPTNVILDANGMLTLPPVVYQSVRYLLRTTPEGWPLPPQSGPFWKSTATYSIASNKTTALLHRFAWKTEVNLLLSYTETAINDIGQLLYLYLCVNHMPIIPLKEKTIIEAKSASVPQNQRTALLQDAIQRINIKPADYVLLYHLLYLLNTISWKAKRGAAEGQKILANVFCDIIGLALPETKLLISKYKEIFGPRLVYQDGEKNAFGFKDKSGKLTATYERKTTSADDEWNSWNAPSA